MTDVEQALAPLVCTAPHSTSSASSRSYYFHFDYADGRTAEAHVGPAVELTRSWMADRQRGALELRVAAGGIEQLPLVPAG